jgi:hypothetical protein
MRKQTLGSQAMVSIAAIIALFLAGCTDNEGGPSSPATSATASAATPTVDPTKTPPPDPSATGSAESKPSGGSTIAPASCKREIAGWTTEPKPNNTMSAAEIYAVRTGRHDCFDRVVFSLNDTAPVGHHVSYVDVTRADGSGQAVPTTGGADLQVIVRAWDFGYAQDGKQPWRKPWKVGQTLYEHDWPALRQVKAAGAHDGQTTFAVGVEERLPVHVFTLVDSQNEVMRVVVDIAHTIH